MQKKVKKIMNEEIKKYPIFLINTAGKLIPISCIKSTDDYDHFKYCLHHYIEFQAYNQNPKWYEERGIKQKLIFMSNICHEHIHNIGIKTLSDKEFEEKYKIKKTELIFKKKSSEY